MWVYMKNNPDENLMSKVTFIDPPNGWKYGFPKILSIEDSLNIREFLLKHGYPENRIDFALKYCRMWEEEVPNENNG